MSCVRSQRRHRLLSFGKGAAQSYAAFMQQKGGHLPLAYLDPAEERHKGETLAVGVEFKQ
jgi:hypothetical protein